jgi:hypothetical protein
MSRSIRVFHAKRMKIRQLRRAYEHSHWWYDNGRVRWWRHGIQYYPISHTPSHWIHDMMTVPMRAKTRMLIERVRKGEDPDGLVWPHAKKPHIYYW